MKKILLSLPILIIFQFLSSHLVAQKPSVSVNNVTGTGVVTLPLHHLQSGKVSMPINLIYSANGIKVKDVEGSGGLGWNLQAGGEIQRVLRGIPDDVMKDNSISNQRVGWLYNTNGSKINAFTILNDNNQGSCADETSDINYLNNNFSDLSDTEPDLFIVNAPGLSCKLVLDADHNIKTIPYMDIKATYVLETSVPENYTSYGRIKSFVITTAAGVTYTFSDLEISTKSTHSSNPSSINFFKRDYQQYTNGINYVSAWKLSSIRDIGGNGFDLFYTQPSLVSGNDRIALTQGNSTTPIYPFTYSNSTKQLRLARIRYGNWDDVAHEQGLKFTYRNAPTSNVQLIDSIIGMGHTYKFDYYDYKLINNVNANKSLLQNVWVNSKQSLSFVYNGVFGEAGTINLPDSTSKAIDFWGFYNGSSETSLLPKVYINPSNSSYEHYRNIGGAGSSVYSYEIPGALRTVNPGAITSGMLATINHYQDGGSTSLEYEPNDYYDQTAGIVIQGGGLRVKKITSFDGINTSDNLMTNYSYINPATGLSSGKPVTVPLLSFTTPYYGSGTTESKIQNSVIRLEENITQEDNGILYSHVRVSQAGAGSSLFEYSVPATNWDNSAGGDWAPTITNFGRTSCEIGSNMTNEKNAYPFPPNTNYDFERGMLKKMAQFDENGNKVRESSYTYQRTGSPIVINALKFDQNAGAMAYAKYSIFSSVGNLIVKEENVTYDAPSFTQLNRTVTNYQHSSPQHKEITGKIQVKSDGSILRSYTKYLKDYNNAPSSDPTAQSMYNLMQQGINFPIERYSQLERNSINKTISASITKFKTWNFQYRPSLELPEEQYNFLSSAGVSDFQLSTISAGVFLKDSRYQSISKVLNYDQSGYPSTILSNGIKLQTTLVDQLTSSPVAVFDNAKISEIAYDNFELHYLEPVFINNINPTISSYSSSARSGSYALSITSSNILSRSIKKIDTRKSFIFSIWINTTSSGNINLSLNSALSGAVSYTLPYDNTASQWKYYQIKVPVTNMAADFTVAFQCSTSLLIDDVLFYPADATVSTSSYDKDSFVKTSTTNTNGVSEYYVYDKFLRLKNIMDQDKNIILKKNYISVQDQDNYKAEIYYSSPFANYPISFHDGNIANWSNEGLAYTWNFGDGSPTETTTQLSGQLSHNYTSPGSYTVTMTKSLAPYGTVTDTKTVEVTNSTNRVKIYASNPMTLAFYQGATLLYVYTAADLATGNVSVPPGTYDVKLMASGQYSASNPSGYKSVGYTGFSTPTTGLVSDCRNSFPNTNAYYFYGLNVTGKQQFNFFIDWNVCTLSEVE